MYYRAQRASGYQLSDKPMAAGGEGSVYDVINRPELVAKIYHADTLRSRSGLGEKLKAMVDFEEARNSQYLAWPQDVLLDEAGSACGFVMTRFRESQDLIELLSVIDLDWQKRLIIAHNLCDVVREIHSLEQVIGDMNPKNFGVDPDRLTVVSFDVDSFHFRSKSGILYPCVAGIDEYYAPEIQKQIIGNVDMRTLDPNQTFTRETDLFALGLLIFALLFRGYHPFTARRKVNYGSSTVVHRQVTNILNRVSPYFNPAPGTTIPVGAPPLDIVPLQMQEMFRQAFLSDTRPSAADWQKEILKVANALTRCQKGHFYWNGKSSCPWCVLGESNQIHFDAADYNLGQVRQDAPGKVVPQPVPSQQSVPRPAPQPVAQPQTPVQPQKSKSSGKGFLIFAAIVVFMIFWARSMPKQPSTGGQTSSKATTASSSVSYLTLPTGTWWDRTSQRANMLVTKVSGNTYSVKISWSQSANEGYTWTFSGDYSNITGALSYSNCVMYEWWYEEWSGERYEVPAYEHGKGTLSYKNGYLYWNDFEENAGRGCVFEKS